MTMTRPLTITNVCLRVVPTPYGDVHLAGSTDSQLVYRLAGLCELGAVTEFVQTYCKAPNRNCHALAFEFAWGLIVSLGADDDALLNWKWCVGQRRGLDVGTLSHSWIEHDLDDEAFDVVQDDNGHAHIYARSRQDFQAQGAVEGYEARTFRDVAVWLGARESYHLFGRYSELSARLNDSKRRVQGKIRGRS